MNTYELIACQATNYICRPLCPCPWAAFLSTFEFGHQSCPVFGKPSKNSFLQYYSIILRPLNLPDRDKALRKLPDWQIQNSKFNKYSLAFQHKDCYATSALTPLPRRHWQTPHSSRSALDVFINSPWFHDECIVYWCFSCLRWARTIMSAKVPPLQSSMTSWTTGAKAYFSFTNLRPSFGPSARIHLFGKLHTIWQRTWHSGIV